MNKILLRNALFPSSGLGSANGGRTLLLNVGTVAYLLIAGIVKKAETAVVMERLCKHIRCCEMGQWMSRDGGHAYAQ
jgi:hypothetical protein